MKRAVLLMILSGCASPPDLPRKRGEKETILQELAIKAGVRKRFRAFYELQDHSTNRGVLLELACDAPDRAKLVYPGRFRVFLEEGFVTAFPDTPRESWYRIAYREEFGRIREEFSAVLRAVEKLCPLARLNTPGKILFDLGPLEKVRTIGNLPVALRISLFPGRFGWLLHLHDPAYRLAEERIFRRDGDGGSAASVEVELLENGFLNRATIHPPPLPGESAHPGITLTLKRVSFAPLPKETFRAPPKGDRKDLSDTVSRQLRSTLANELEKSMFREIVRRFPHPLSETDRERLTDFFALLYRVDLQATHDLEGMVDRVREGQEKMVRFAKKEFAESADRRETLKRTREEMMSQYRSNLDHLDRFEARVGKEYRTLLRRTLAGLFASGALQQDLGDLSRAGLERALEEGLRVPVRKVFEEAAASLPDR
jgi:hypothetical protein